MKKYISTLVSKIVDVLIGVGVVAILFCVYNIISLKVLNNDYVNVFGYTFFQVVSGSMSGSIEIGDAVIVDITDEYAIGDVVTYKKDNDYITHRVVYTDKDYIITKGDANNSNDKMVKKSDVLGKVVKVIPNVATIKNFILTPKVIAMVIGILLSFSLLISYNNYILKSRNYAGLNGVEKRKLRRKDNPKKKIEYTQVLNKDAIKAASKDLDYTQILNAPLIKKKAKKSLEFTQVIDTETITKKGK